MVGVVGTWRESWHHPRTECGMDMEVSRVADADDDATICRVLADGNRWSDAGDTLHRYR